jgi:hypothetical protein
MPSSNQFARLGIESNLKPTGYCSAGWRLQTENLMFRLFKLAAYVLLGYAIYEFVAGLLLIDDEKYRRSHPAAANPSKEGSAEAGKMNFTGPGDGQTVSTTGFAGERATHRVGRGVVAR